MRHPKYLFLLLAGLFLLRPLTAQTTALDCWQTDNPGASLNQLDGFSQATGASTNGSIISGAASDLYLNLTPDSTNLEVVLQSKSTLAVPSALSAIPFVVVHGRLTLYGSSGSAGIGISDGSAFNSWYYLLLNGTQIILRKSIGGTESNVGSWTFNSASSAADIRLVANYATAGQISFTIRYGTVGGAITTQTATDFSPVTFSSGNLRTRVVTRNGRVVDFTQATRVLQPNIEPATIAFPASANIVNVKSAPYNAKGDGVTDDTAAIQAAINAQVGFGSQGWGMRTLYIPNGTYIVSKRLEWKRADGTWENLLTLQGQSRSGTIIKLRDNCNGTAGTDNFTNAATPRAVIFTASELNSASPVAGGKDWTNLGEGNAGFGNSIFNITVDTGTGNAGAVAVDYLTNNNGSLKSVTLRSGDGQGVAGLGLIRKWTGPLLVKDVLIDGFQNGILLQNTNYSATIEHVTLRNQTAFGIDNQAGAVLAIRGLLFRNGSAAAVGIRNNGAGGLVTIMESALLGANSTSAAIVNSGGGTSNQASIYARCIITDGFAAALAHNGTNIGGASVEEYVSGGALAKFSGSALTALHLPVEETPVFFETTLSNWINVQDFGANPDDNTDDTSAIQAAIDSTATGAANAGKTVLYFPQPVTASGRYLVSSTILLRHGIRKVEGNFARLTATGTYFEDWNFTNPVLRVNDSAIAATNAQPVFIERLAFDTENLTVTPLSIEHNSSRTLALKHTDCSGLRSSISSGKIFLEDVTANHLTSLFRFEGSNPVYARQLNPEDLYNTKVRVVGTRLWCLGFKTERPSSAIHAAAGSRVEILGGLLNNAVHPSPDGLPAVIVEDAAVSLSYAVVGASNSGGNTYRYDVDVRETRSGVTLEQTLADSPNRPGGGANYTPYSSLLPLYSAWNGLGATSLPYVNVTATTPYASEPSTIGQFTFTRSGSTATAITISYTISGNAQPGSDYTPLSGSVTIPAGARSTAVDVIPIDDNEAEFPEQVTVTVNSTSTQLAGYPSQSTVVILDNDRTTGSPPASSLVLWLRADTGALMDPLGRLLSWRDQSGNNNNAVIDESMRAPAWYQGISGQFVSQPQVTFSNRSFLLLQPSATLQRAAGGYTAKTHAIYFRTGSDVNTRQILWEQGSDTRGLNLYISGDSLYAGVWNAPSAGGWQTFRSTAIASNTEYLAVLAFDSVAGTVSAWLNGNAFSGASTSSGTVGSLPTQGDISSLGGLVSKTLFHDGAPALSGFYFTGAIAEIFAWNSAISAAQRDDLRTYIQSKYSASLVYVSLSANKTTAAETPYEEGAFVVTRTGDLSAPLTLNYTISGTATNGADYQTLPGSITLPAGAGSANIFVRPLVDAVSEWNETVTLTLQSGPGYTLSGSITGTVTILQDILLPRSIDRTVAPGLSGNTTITLVNPSSTSAVTFTLTIPSNYTATRSDSTASNRPTYSWQEIITNNRRDAVIFDYSNAAPSTPGFPGGDHDTPSPAVPLGFTFPFYGSNYSNVRVSCDGWMSFDPAAPAAPQNLDLAGGNPSAPAAIIAPFWRTQSCGNTASVVAYKRPDANTFIVQWYQMSSGIGTDGVLSEVPHYQAILKSDGTIFFSYYLYTVPASPVRPYSIGVQNAARNQALSLRSGTYDPVTATYMTFNPSYLSTLPLTVRLDPPAAWLSASATSFTIPPGGSATIALNLSTTGLVTGDTRSYTIPVTASLPGSPSLELPVVLRVGTPSAPSISAHPASQTVNVGATASFSIAAEGTAPLAYQWQRSNDSGGSWSNIVGATAAAYTTGALGAGDSGARFRCLVSNQEGSLASAAATVTVSSPPPPPAITAQPLGSNIASGASAILSVTATGEGVLTYQWYQGASGVTTTPVPGATASTFNTPALQTTTSYWVRVSNLGGAIDSAAATVTTATAGAFSISASPASIAEGDIGVQTVTITITRSGGSFGPVSVAYATADGSANAGVDYLAASGTLAWADGETGGKSAQVTIYGDTLYEPDEAFTISLSNPTGFATLGTASITITILNDDAPPPPSITAQPVDISVSAGISAAFSVTAAGAGPLSYQWQRSDNGGALWTDLSGATASSFTTGQVSTADSGARFRCRVTNAGGSIVSNAATLTVTPAGNIVDWGGDYVSASRALQGAQSTATGDFNADGVALDFRRWIPFASGNTLSPATGYSAPSGKSGIFSGGVVVENYGLSGGSQTSVATFPAGGIGVVDSTTVDRIRIGSDTTGEWAWGLVLFPKSGFLLGNTASNAYRLDTDSRFTFTVASARNSQFRFVVVSRGLTYVSQAFSASQSNLALASLSWFSWAFAETGDSASAASLKIASPSAVASPDFTDVTTVGFTVQAVPVASPWTDRSSLNVSAFQVRASVVTFANWIASFPSISGASATATADPDGDGLQNLLEYALGGNPTTSDAAVYSPVADINAGRLRLSFRADTARTDITYVVQASGDLVTWTDIASCLGGAATTAINSSGATISDSGSGARTVAVTDPVFLTTNLRRFLRLKVVSN